MSLINEALQRAREESVRQEAARRGVPLAPSTRQTEKGGWLAATVLILAIALTISLLALLGLSRQPAGQPTTAEVSGPVEVVTPRESDSADDDTSIQRDVPLDEVAPFPASNIESVSSPEVEASVPLTAEAPHEPVETDPNAAGDQTENGPRLEKPVERRITSPESIEAALPIYIRYADLGDGVSIELGGIAWSESGPYALLNGRVVGIGESVSGYVVREIDPLEVILEGPNRRLAVRLK